MGLNYLKKNDVALYFSLGVRGLEEGKAHVVRRSVCFFFPLRGMCVALSFLYIFFKLRFATLNPKP